MGVRYRYISADNHLGTRWLPKNLWQERLPARLRERGPRVAECDEGSFWTWEGRRRKEAADGRSHAKLCAKAFGALVVPDGRLPPSDPPLAAEHMDRAGIWGAVFFGDTRKWAVEDRELLAAMHRAYNDFCLELSAAAAPRLVYLPNLPGALPGECLAELRRVSDRGARAVELGMFDLGAPLHDPVWEALWAEAEARGVVVCSHTGHGAGVPRPPLERAHAHHSTSPFVAARPIAEMVFGGVFERHPRLVWVMAEARIGWLPFFVSWMDRQVSIREAGPIDALSLPPSEYVRRNVRVTFEDDPVGGRLLHEPWSGLQEIVLWGCDYPHPQGVWPDPEPVVERMLEGLDPSLRDEILFDRAARLFGMGRPGARQ